MAVLKGRKETGNDKLAPFGTTYSPRVMAEEGDLKKRTHRGLPLLTRKEFDALYRTESAPDAVRTFNFRGYVEEDDGNIVFQDVVATNGLRDGIRAGIAGCNHNWITSLKHPDDLSRYEVYVVVPRDVQIIENVVCRDSCTPTTKYEREGRENGWAEEETQEEIEKARDGNHGWIVVRLNLEPRKDPNARKAVEILALAINKYIKSMMPLERLSNFIYAAESHIKSNTKMMSDENLLQEGADMVWKRFVENLKRAANRTCDCDK